jgi:hypothetical protein
VKLPPLPKNMFSILGLLPVGVLDSRQAEEHQMFGLFMPDNRIVAIADAMTDEMKWVTFWHEATHVALCDSGVAHTLTKEQTEAVCDAVGAYLTATMRAGMLRATTGKS